MVYRLTSILILVAIALHGTFGSLQGTVVFCLGGGHEHEPTEVVEHCELACSHKNEWPAPAESDDHRDDCECTDIELGLVDLLLAPRIGDQALPDASSVPVMVATIPRAPTWVLVHERPPILLHDPGGTHRLSLIRSTRLNV